MPGRCASERWHEDDRIEVFLNRAAEYVDRVAAGLRALLGEALVGVYAGGSLALGDFDPVRNDVDVAAVPRGTSCWRTGCRSVRYFATEVAPVPRSPGSSKSSIRQPA